MDSSGLQNEISSLFSTKVDIELLSEQKMGFSGASVKEVKLNWEGEATGLPDKLFIKHIILTAPSDDVSEADKTKAERNRLSYINEVNVLEYYAPALRTAGLHIPETYKVLHNVQKEEEHFLFISESMNEQSTQVPSCNKEQFNSVLQYLAKMHAVHHGTLANAQDAALKEDPYSMDPSLQGVWSQGTHLALSKRPEQELIRLAQHWEAFCDNFSWQDFSSLGRQLQDAAPLVAERLSPFSTHTRDRLTLVHGDLKTANFFFRSSSPLLSSSQTVCDGENDGSGSGDGKGEGGSSFSSTDDALMGTEETEKDELAKAEARTVTGGGAGSVSLIDFQWTGPGLAATDLVYVLFMSCEDNLIQGLDVREDVLKPYHSAFLAAYERSNVHEVTRSDGKIQIEDRFPFSLLEQDFQLATLDFARWVVACRLGGETPEKYAARRAKVDPNLGTYRRSEVVMKFLMSLVKEYLPHYGPQVMQREREREQEEQ